MSHRLRGAIILGAAAIFALGSAGCDSPSPTPGPSADIIGTWRGTTRIGVDTVSVETIFQPNGRYSQLTVSNSVNGVAGSLEVRITANYELDPDLGVIKLTNMKSEPAQQCLVPSGCHRILVADSETDSYAMEDANTLTISNGTCGPACTITYTRASP